MSKSLTAATGSFSSTCSMPEDGVDYRTAASLETGRQTVFNNTGYLNTRQIAHFTTYPPAFVRRELPFAGVIASNWNPTNGTWTTTATTGAIWGVDADFPVGVTLTELRFRVKAAGSHVGLPGTMPVAGIYKWSSDTLTLIASASDASGGLVSYESWHEITVTLSEVIDGTTRYIVQLQGESGTNALVGLQIQKVQATWTAP